MAATISNIEGSRIGNNDHGSAWSSATPTNELISSRESSGPEQQRPVVTDDTSRFERTESGRTPVAPNASERAAASVREVAWVDRNGKFHSFVELLDVRAIRRVAKTGNAAHMLMREVGVKGSLEEFPEAGWHFALPLEAWTNFARVFMTSTGRVRLFSGRMRISITSPREAERLKATLAKEGFQLQSDLPSQPNIYTIVPTGGRDAMELLQRFAANRFVSWIEPELVELEPLEPIELEPV